MPALLRAAELLVVLMLIVWTVVFPLATLISLLVTLPIIAIVTARPARLRLRTASSR
jgi:hypothetical protein